MVRYLFYTIGDLTYQSPLVILHRRQGLYPSNFSERNLLKLFIIIIGIQPLGRSGHRPEFSQATGMALVRCILGKFLGISCHCFPPLFGVPTFQYQVPPRPLSL